MRKKPNQPTLELYKLAVEMADRVSARRGAANQFYLSLETLILGTPLVAQYLGRTTLVHPERLTALSAAGILVAVVWWLQLRSYRDLNSAKFKVINDMEVRHFDDKVFLSEWQELKKDPVSKWRKRYAELGTVERFVPWLFATVQAWIIFGVWI